MITPGPWTARCRDVSFVDGMDWPKERFLQFEVDGPEVPTGRGDFHQADAYLIAAAPDLLAALGDIAEEYDAWLQWAIQVGEIQKRDREKAERKIAKARAAIKKARGQS